MGPRSARTADANATDYMAPASFVLLDDIPVTANGKLDKAALPAPTKQISFDARITSNSGTELEEIVEGVVGPILGSRE